MHYCYVIVENLPDMTCTNILSTSDKDLDERGLNDEDDTLGLLRKDGWRPVRETPMGPLKTATAALVLLER